MIRLQDIDRVYNVGDQKVYALNRVSLQIAAGEYVSIMGPSGSGKSTLLHILGLLDRPSSGQYLLDNEDILSLDEETQSRTRREKIGFVFQFFHLIPRLSAAENIGLPMMLAGIPAAERKRRVDKLLRDTALQDRARHRPDQLSGGQQQRVAIARAMVMDPAVLLADEPTGNLDRNSGNEIIQLLEQLNSEGLTLIVVTHDRSIGSRARRQIQMEDGKIIADTVTKPAQ